MSSPPFGIQKGFSKNDIKVGEEISGYTYAVTDVPKPHSVFKRVFAQITPLQGVSYIFAESWLIPLNDLSRHRKIYYKLMNQLLKKYGEPAKSDFVYEFFYGNGDLYHQWGGDKPSLINNLTSLQLKVCRKDSFHGFFVLSFFYDNYDQALEEIINLDEDAI